MDIVPPSAHSVYVWLGSEVNLHKTSFSTIINIDGTSEVANNNIWQMVTGPFVPAIGCGTPAPPSRAASVTASTHRHIGKSAQSYIVSWHWYL